MEVSWGMGRVERLTARGFYLSVSMDLSLEGFFGEIRVVGVLGWDCGWDGASLEVMLVEGLYFAFLKLYSTREHPHRASVCF